LSIAAIYAFAGILIDAAWFYFPFAICTLFLVRSDASILRIGVPAGLYMAGWSHAMNYMSSGTDVAAIASSWHAQYPRASMSALLTVKRDISIASNVGVGIWYDPIRRNGFLAGLALGCIPIVWLWLERNSSDL
jgi:hypothetical protein